MIAARQRARQRARCIAAEPVGDEPLLLRQHTASLVGRIPPDGSHQPGSRSGDCRCVNCSALSWHFLSSSRVLATTRRRRARDAPSGVGRHLGRSRAAVIRILARPGELPFVIVGRREQRFSERCCIDFDAKVYKQHAFIFRARRRVAQHQQFGAEHRAVDRGRVLCAERRLAASKGQQVAI